VLPELTSPDDRPAPVDRESRRALATEAGRLLLDAVAGSGALLLVDDLQWADGTSLHLLEISIARVQGIRAVFAHRPGEVREPDPVGAFLDSLVRGGEVVRVELGPLDADELERLVGDAEVARAIAAGTTATPLVASEAIRLLEERGGLEADADGRRRPLREIPAEEAEDAARSGERRAALARVERLDRRERAILESLAALGRETAAATLAAALDRPASEALGSLDALTRAGLVRLDERGWTFAHQSVADAVSSGLEPGERIGVHTALRRVLEAEGADPSEVARHAAAAGDVSGAIDGYAEAAERALARYANDESAQLAEAALELGPAGPRRIGLLAIRAEARARSGALDAAKADLREALAAGPADPERADLLTRLAVLESGSEDYEAAGRLVELALAAAGDDPRRRAEAHAVGAIVDLNLGDLDGSERRASTALALFEANGDAHGAAGILDGRAMATFLGGRVAEAAAAFDRVARLFRDAGELLRVGTPRSTRGHALVFLAEPEAGLTDVEEALELARSLGHAEGESYARWHRAEALAALGRGEEAVTSATEALAIAERIPHREWTVASLRGLGIALEASGELDRAIEAHRRGLAEAEGLPLFATWAAARLASCLVRAGRLDEAAEALARGLPDRSPLGAYEARLAEAELRRARGDADLATFAADAARIAEDFGHVVSAIRLRELAGGQPSA
jgi:tetratricopeptide (TPR) repeat protein